MDVQGNISIADPIILTGDTAPKARFGTSMVKLGDVNDDGFEGRYMYMMI